MTGWEIRQAVLTILAHDDQVILTGLTWVSTNDNRRLAQLARRASGQGP